ncbi:hypothetical protein [Halanaeroarchaeum sulfurireducens]|uniref:DUF4157 domain-containing protein n=1 Tax=Halanaeroarchaeum sulfurireducens TaxID=1604004 RepID=A0A0F7P9J3_9EURY|nr:hypothetical protein [Halanaeroarchaeum sulfurireducens]AKH97806.1 hypothetical protein HLASF_1320 [Halanaeroarchaeum sulfurireducens]ALG82200.1 hypothetical protein HLASA_1307 [Halanaeroarchaeum sulfurireducens]
MRRVALAIAVLVVLAGSPSGIAPPDLGSDVARGDSHSSPEPIRVPNGSLPVDPDALYADVTTTLEVDAAPPRAIHLERNDHMEIHREPMPSFFRLVGIERPPSATRTATALGYVEGPSTVHLNEELLDDEAQARSTLVHEYVHVVQLRTDAFERVRAGVSAPNTTDGTIVRRAVLEGAAVTVETQYWERRDGDGPSPATEMTRSYRSTTGARQWIFAPYHYGHAYVQTRTDSPEAVERLYESPPRTSEELLHGLSPGSEPLPPLSVSVDAADWEVQKTDRAGELFVRVALDTELSAERAATAATGWGTDSRVTLSNGDDRAYVWALRWDDPANATEFQAGFEAYLDERATSGDGVWHADGAAYRTTRVDEETVAVLLGNESFVDGVTVEGTNGSVVASA